MTSFKLALTGAAVLVGTSLAFAQTPESGGSSTPGTATLAGPAQKAGASNQKAGGGHMKSMKAHHKKKM